jgi:hypothetical protein
VVKNQVDMKPVGLRLRIKSKSSICGSKGGGSFATEYQTR